MSRLDFFPPGILILLLLGGKAQKVRGFLANDVSKSGSPVLSEFLNK